MQNRGQSNFESLGSVINDSIKKIGLEERFKEHQFLPSWEKIVGSQIAMFTEPLYIKFKVLYVSVSNHIWMQELKFFEEEMINKINSFTGKEAVKRISFRLKN